MTTLWGIALLATACVYAARVVWWSVGLRREIARTAALEAPSDDALPTVTVVVAARDEEATIGPCVDSVLAVDYPCEKLELIVVDDDSSDRTAAVVRERMASTAALAPAGGGLEARPPGAPGLDADESEGDGRLRLLRMPENRHRTRAHKKRAIEKAVGHARGEIILTTDADCTVPPGWARAMAAQFEGAEVAFVSGPVTYALREGDGVFVRYQALDFFGLMACAAGGIGMGQPNLANGACAGYRRETFEALGGFSGIDHVTSGDDELLMQKVAYQTPLDVRFCADPAALVRTEPTRSLRAFLHQRKRWASKTSNYPAHLNRMLAGLGAFLVLLTLTWVALPAVPALWPWLLGALAVKVAGEAQVARTAIRHFDQGHLLSGYALHVLLQAPQVVLAFGTGLAPGGFEWKDRRLDQ